MSGVMEGLVKPLVWVEDPLREYHYTAGPYAVTEIGLGRWWLSINGNRSDVPHPYCREAQAAAEADYRARIAAALRVDLIEALAEALQWIAENDDAGDMLYHADGPFAKRAKAALAAFRAAATGGEG